MRDLRLHLFLVFGIALIAAGLFLRPDLLLSLNTVCVLRSFFGIRCPFCGMTRDFVSMAQGRFVFLNPFSPLMAVLMFVVYPAVIVRCWRSRKDFPLSSDRGHAVVLASVLLMLLLNNLAGRSSL